jgi:hypothetical protein
VAAKYSDWNRKVAILASLCRELYQNYTRIIPELPGLPELPEIYPFDHQCISEHYFRKPISIGHTIKVA